MNQIISAFTDKQVKQLTGLSVQQLQYWDRTGFFEPEFAFENRRAAYSRIYSYRDVVALKIVARLREDASLQELRRVKEELSRYTPDLWRGLTLWVHGGRISFLNPNTGEPEEVVSGQKLMRLPLAETLDDLDAKLRALFERDPTVVGQIEQNRRVLSNRPVISGTRIPVSAIQSFHEAGYSLDAILEEYPSLTADDVKAAIAASDAA